MTKLNQYTLIHVQKDTKTNRKKFTTLSIISLDSEYFFSSLILRNLLLSKTQYTPYFPYKISSYITLANISSKNLGK